MLSTFETSKYLLLKLIDSSFEQLANIEFILITFDVLKLCKYNEAKEVQFENKWSILVTNDVSRKFKFNVVMELQL